MNSSWIQLCRLFHFRFSRWKVCSAESDMANPNELEHPLLEEGHNNSHAPVQGLGPGTGQAPAGLYKGILVKCEEDHAYPPYAWRGYCGHPPELQQQQLLDPCSLPRTLETFYPTAPVWGHADSLLSKDCLETTFVDIRPGSSLERKLLAESQDFNSMSYSMDDEDDLLPDSDVRQTRFLLLLLGFNTNPIFYVSYLWPLWHYISTHILKQRVILGFSGLTYFFRKYYWVYLYNVGPQNKLNFFPICTSRKN